jgi:hypothetical protein
MDTDQWIKISPVITTIVFGASTLWLSIKQHLDGNKDARREDYKFAKIFFDDLKANPEMHPFARKRGFQVIGKNQDLAPSVVEYLMNFPDPIGALNDYEASKGYLQDSEETGRTKLFFAGAFLWSTENRRKNMSAGYLACAVIFYLLAFAPWFLLTIGKISVAVAINLSIVFLPIGIFIAVVAAREFIQLRRAMRLIKNQGRLVDVEDASG